MGFLGLFNAYAMRACLSITITQMVVPPEHTTEFKDDTCQLLENMTQTAGNSSGGNAPPQPLHGGTYEWSEYTQVYYTYAYISEREIEIMGPMRLMRVMQSYSAGGK